MEWTVLLHQSFLGPVLNTWRRIAWKLGVSRATIQPHLAQTESEETARGKPRESRAVLSWMPRPVRSSYAPFKEGRRSE